MNKDTNIIVRVDKGLKQEFYELVDDKGYSVSEVILACIKDICKKNKIPNQLMEYLGNKREKNKISIPQIKKALQEIIIKSYENKIEKAYLFGSYSRGEETINSDIDIRLITKGEFSLFDLNNISEELKEVLNKEVDIITSGNLDETFFKTIKAEEICIYE